MGWFSKHAILKVTGDMYSLGGQSRDSQFTIDGHAHGMAYESTRCTYRIIGAESAEINQIPEPEGMSLIMETGFTLKIGRDDSYWDTHLWERFWEEGNRLLIPDDEGGWKEVTPDG